ncbi:DUF4389 domain-containing protein [Phycicoccus sp.]|mgnify:CR=1 FL=1|uniref:DUF4389 domain-containing protein n=1 Tax=Phycicoccus sp. TaxID=1902410 RepID=UPI002D1FA602|nr:DUF4389 domain-containing protein [Phycicoccus sp.]
MTTYPVHVRAHLDTPVSRWLWLVKWVLAIPHYVVLAFLWAAFVVLSVVAFVAIAVTGRYPRSIFDFNVGVLRWHWRVACYGYSALGTDRYPPFTLHDVADYPAHLEVEYPEHLSRGLVWVKWWLLAIPHYLVVGVLVGGTYALADAGNRTGYVGLIPLLVCVAAVLLLFTGRYPQALFDLVLGLNRWVLRVAAYAGLMTDAYPPFRLDQGEDDGLVATYAPGRSAPPVTHATGAGAPARPAPRGWSPGRVVSVVAGAVVALTTLGTALGGAALLVVDRTGRDGSGFVSAPSVVLSSGGYAVTSVDLTLRTGGSARLAPDRVTGDVRLTATAAGDTPVFLGVGRADEVAGYLDGVASATLTGARDGQAVLRSHPGSAPGAAPADAGVWTDSVSGSGTQTLTVTPRAGDWTVVLMNADGSRGIDATVTAGAELPTLGALGTGLLVLAGSLLVAALLLVVLPLSAVERDHRALREPAAPGH